jgi:hypothetical protein
MRAYVIGAEKMDTDIPSKRRVGKERQHERNARAQVRTSLEPGMNAMVG